MSEPKRPPGLIARRWIAKKTGETKTAYYYRPGRKRAKGQGTDPRKPIPLGTDYRKALEKWAQLHGAELELPTTGTVAQVYADYLKWAEQPKLSKLTARTVADREYYWRHLAPVFGHIPIDDLQSPWMFAYFEQRSSQVTAKKELKFLSVLCNWAKARGRMTAPNPLAGIMRQLHVQEHKDIYVQDAWYQLTWRHATQYVRDAMDFTYLCGNRPNESERATKRDITGGELAIALAKTRRSGIGKKRIPIAGELADYIERQRQKRPSSVYLVSDEHGQPLRTKSAKFRREWADARNAAQAHAKAHKLDYQRFALMDIRAKAATDIAEQHDLEAARRLLGHTTQNQTADYIRTIQGISAQAIDAINR